jgi:ribonuclease P protein subunit POP4
MSLTPETLTRHELNGLPIRVVDAANPDLVGIAGRVVFETQQTLHVDSGATRSPRARGGCEARNASTSGDESREAAERGSGVRQVPKRGTTFEFELVDEVELDVAPAGDGSTDTDTDTDEAAEDRKASGSALERESETPGVRPGQSGSTHEGSRDASGASRDCESAVYVTVDGTRLLSRPAHRTEVTGDSQWR